MKKKLIIFAVAILGIAACKNSDDWFSTNTSNGNMTMIMPSGVSNSGGMLY